MFPKFTVVIPTYNRSAFIGRALDSVLGQTLSGTEVIVVDDGSTDGTLDVVSRYIKLGVACIPKKINAERGAARNSGAAIASGDFVTFLDSDDMLLPNCIQVATNFVRQNPD